MKYEPHEYQKYAIDYIETHPFAAVLLDMGLGKTSITLTAIGDLLFDSFEVHRVLVIAPLRVARIPGVRSCKSGIISTALIIRWWSAVNRNAKRLSCVKPISTSSTERMYSG